MRICFPTNLKLNAIMYPPFSQSDRGRWRQGKRKFILIYISLNTNNTKQLFFFLIFYCILGFGVHVQNMQESCIGTHMAVCFASFLPFTHIWHFSPGYPSPALPHPLVLPFPPTTDPVCDASLPVSMCSHCSTLTYE